LSNGTLFHYLRQKASEDKSDGGGENEKNSLRSFMHICFNIFIFRVFKGKKVFDELKLDTELEKKNTEFCFDIFSKLNEEDYNKNIFISPLSISTVLSMTVQGAGTTTKDGMLKALKYDGMDLDKINESYRYILDYLSKTDKTIELEINNSIWIREGKQIKKDFIDINKDVYNAYVTELDFSSPNAADRINKWISDSTKKKITDIIDSPIPENTAMFLINAIYFKGDWAEKFKKQDTFTAKFQSGNGQTKEVMMMERKDTIEYGAKEDFKVVRLPYGKGTTSMYCVLPAKDVSINDFIKTLDVNKWEEIKNSISKAENVTLNIPRFKIAYGTKELRDCLIAMGMEEAFTERADFSGISEGLLFIDSVIHKAIIEVNEDGSTAAGSTVVRMIDGVAIGEPLSFIADRPFLFFITEDVTGTILFMGKLYDCEKY